MKSFHWRLLFLFLGIMLFFPFRILQAVSLFGFLFLLVLWTISVNSASRISCRMERSEFRAVSREEIEVRFFIDYSGIFPLFAVRLEFLGGGLFFIDAKSKLFNLKPGDSREMVFRAMSHRRGEFKAGPFILEATDPTGFFSWKKELFPGLRFIIYPTIHEFDPKETSGFPGGRLLSHDIRNHDTTRLKNIRPFLTGDSPRYIHWKASARSGQLQVKEFERTLESPLLIWLDMNRSKYPAKERYGIMEQAVSAAATLAEWQFRSGQSLGFLTNGCDGEGNGFDLLPLSGTEDWFFSVMNILALVRECEEKNLAQQECLFSLPDRTRVAVITSSLNEAEMEFLSRLKLRNLFCELYIISNSSGNLSGLESCGFPLIRVNPVSGRIG